MKKNNFKLIFGLFLILHGLIHLLYLGLSQDLITDPDIHWSRESWLLSNFLSDGFLKDISLILYSASILFFLVAGLLYMTEFKNRKAVVYFSAIFSTITILIFWNGSLQHLDDQGFVGILINIIIMIIVYLRSSKFQNSEEITKKMKGVG